MDASLSLPLTREAAIANSHDWDAEFTRRNRCRKITYDFLHPRDQGIEKYYSRIFYYSALALQWLLVSLVAINVTQAAVFLILLHWDVKLDDASQIVAGSDVVVVLTTVVFTLTFLLRLWSCVEEHPSLSLDPWRTRGRFLRRPLNALDLLSVILLWCIILQPLEHGFTQEAGAGGALSVAWRLGFKRILLALFVASGGVGQASYNQVLTPKAKADGRMVEEKILEYDFQADSWRPNRRQSHAGDSKQRSVFENLPQEDAFGFDPKSGGKFRLLLVMSAALSSMISFFVDRGAGVLQMLTNDVLDFFLHVFGGLRESSFLGFFILLLCNACLLWSAYALVRLSPEAAGSGLPEVKCILSGISLENFLKPRVLAAKSIGLMLVLGESLPVGKEGPFVHIASCVSAALLNWPMFARVSLDRQEVLLAAVAVGVGATFSAPVGGVLFALELMMPRLYDTSSYSACFFASTFGTFVFMCLNMITSGSGQLKPLFNSDITAENSPTLAAEIVFIILCLFTGALSGALASSFVLCHRKAVGYMNALRGLAPLCGEQKAGQSVRRDMLVFLGAAAVGALLRVGTGIKLLTLGTGPFLTEIFRREAHLQHPELAKASGLLFLAVAKTSYTIMALSMPVPAGVVAPSLMLGGIFGRCVAAAIPQSMQEFLAPDGDFGQYIARFAIVGATCFCGAVCRVNSVVVTVFELIAVPRLILPLTLATIVSNVCANRIGPSIFDSILLMKKIPAMPTLRAIQKTLQPVRKVLDKSLLGCCLPRHAVAHDFSHLKFVRSGMEAQGRNLPLYIPIVEEIPHNREKKLVLLGAVSWEDLELLQKYEGTDMLQAAAKLGGILKDPLRISPNTSLKQAYLESQATSRPGPMMVVEDGFLVGILPHSDLLERGAAEQPR